MIREKEQSRQAVRYMDILQEMCYNMETHEEYKIAQMIEGINGMPMYETHNGRRTDVVLYHRGDTRKKVTKLKREATVQKIRIATEAHGVTDRIVPRY